MERSVFLRELKKSKLIAHRLGYKMTNYPENSLNVLESIFSNKELLDVCDGFEFDVCFTKDNIPVVMHDKYLDDISDSVGMVKKHTLEELQKINFGFRKRFLKKQTESFIFKIVTLEELLMFFENNLDLLGKKVIKIDTKEMVTINHKKLFSLAKIINDFSSLNKNIVHLSFHPQNLSVLRKIQIKHGFKTVKTDLLCNYKAIITLSRFMNNLDNISLRIKSKDFIGKCSKENSFKTNFDIFWSSFFMNFSNTINEETIKYVINRFGSVGVFVLNGDDQIKELCQNIGESFFKKNAKRIVFTTNNPYYLRGLR